MEQVKDDLKANLDATAMQIGMLWINLLGLETILRLCLATKQVKINGIDKVGKIKTGDIVPADIFFNCDMLSNVIEKFIKEFGGDKNYLKYGVRLDRDWIVKIRNAFGHGYTLSHQVFPIRLINLSPIKNDNKNVKVVFAEEITPDFIKTINKSLCDEIKKLATFWAELKRA
jgi:hypothetical protein